MVRRRVARGAGDEVSEEELLTAVDAAAVAIDQVALATLVAEDPAAPSMAPFAVVPVAKQASARRSGVAGWLQPHRGLAAPPARCADGAPPRRLHCCCARDPAPVYAVGRP